MNEVDGLKGTLVLVHPGLTDDPAMKQNTIGLITTADIQNDDIFVSFSGSKPALYSGNALLILKPQEEVHQHLADNAYTLALPDLIALTKLDLILHYASPGYLKTAFELAQKNPNIHLFSLDTLNDRLNRAQAQQIQR